MAYTERARRLPCPWCTATPWTSLGRPPYPLTPAETPLSPWEGESRFDPDSNGTNMEECGILPCSLLQCICWVCSAAEVMGRRSPNEPEPLVLQTILGGLASPCVVMFCESLVLLTPRAHDERSWPVGFAVGVSRAPLTLHVQLQSIPGPVFQRVQHALRTAAAGGGAASDESSHLLSPTVLCQIVSVAGDDDADFAFGVAQVTAGSFRLQYEDETTDCIRYVRSEI